MNNLKYRADIDGLRAVAVVPVVLGHAGIYGFSGGYVGVDIFFVISGFLITSILMKEVDQGHLSIGRFYERRARRILPALLTVLFACFLAGWFILEPSAFESLGKSTIATLLFFSNFWFWHATGDYFSASAEFEPLLHTWSLGVEEQFYLLFPLFLWFFGVYARRWLVPAIVVCCVASLALSIWATPVSPDANFFFSPTRVWELGLGVLLAVGAFPQTKRSWLPQIVSALGLLAIIICIVFYDASTPFPGLAALPPCLGAVAIIWAGAHHRATYCGKLLSTAPFVFFGLISYSLYLWHWPILAFSRVVHESVELGPEVIALALVASVAFAYLSWRFVERPFRTRRVGLPMLIGSLGVASASALGICVALIFSNGVPTRIDSEILADYNAAGRRAKISSDCMKASSKGKHCQIETESAEGLPPSVLLWGDSHAAAMLPGFSDWLDQRGLAGIAAVKAACPPLLNLVRVNPKPWQRCHLYTKQIMDFVTADSGIEMVVLHGRWAMAAEGTRAPGETGPPFLLTTDKSKVPDSTDWSQEESVTYGLEQVIKRLTEKNIRVLIVEGVPEIGWRVPGVLLRDQLLRRPEHVTPDIDDITTRNATASRIFDTVAAKYPVERVRFSDLLCDPECAISRNDKLLYRDDDHLSVYAAKLLVPQVFDSISTQ